MIPNLTGRVNNPYIVALTGGIASGKTLISDEFARLGVPIIDTDVISRRLVEPGQPALKEIEEKLGLMVIDKNGHLKRSELRALIFTNPDVRKQLESILHPKIKKEAYRAIKAVTSAYCILVIPLLAEGGHYPNINRILVVDVEPSVQIARLMNRDNCNGDQAKLALAAQASRQQRLKIADDILDNSGSLRQTRDKVAFLHDKYKQLAARQ